MSALSSSHRFLQLLAGASLPFLAAAAQAQTAPDAGRAAEQIQREQQQRQQQQLEQQRRSLPAPKGGEDSASETQVTSGADAPCRDIREVSIGSTPNLPNAERTRLTQAYSGRCLNVHDIEQLMADITNSYIRRGYVTTRVYLPQQDLSTGRLSVMVVEGVVEKITLAGKRTGRISLGNALPGIEGELLNLRDLEQGLDQINRLQSNRARVDIEPGSAPGASRIVVHNDAGRTVHFGATLDSMGQRATGREQAGTSLAFDSPLGLNDYASFAYRQSLPLNSSTRQSQLGSFIYLIPYGYTTTSLSYSHSEYESLLHTPSDTTLAARGTSDIAAARFEDVLHRSRSHRVTFAAALTSKASRNHLEEQFLSVSSRNLSVADASLNYTTGLWGGVVSLEGGHSWGLHAMGAIKDPEGLAVDAPRAQFRRINYSATYSVPFRMGGLDASFSSSFAGQRAKTPLYGSEQLLVGGLYSVRGFDQSSLSGDNGYFWRNELAIRRAVGLGAQFQGVVRPFVAVDFGRTSMREGGTGTPEDALSGATFGFSLGTGSVALELFNSRPLHVPAFMEREGSQTYFRFSISL